MNLYEYRESYIRTHIHTNIHAYIHTYINYTYTEKCRQAAGNGALPLAKASQPIPFRVPARGVYARTRGLGITERYLGLAREST